MEMATVYFLACCLAVCVGLVSGYPDGNMLPVTVCGDMKPRSAIGVSGLEGHMMLPLNRLPGAPPILPFYIHIHQEEKDYAPGAQIAVSVIANQTKGVMYYTGLLLQARKVICASNSTVKAEEKAHGSFIVPTNPRESLLATMDCTGENSKSAVRHRSNAFKINETFTWKAPDENVGHIVFRAVIVQQGDFYWSEVNSRILREPGHPEVAPPRCGSPNVRVSEGVLLSVTMAAVYLTVRELL